MFKKEPALIMEAVRQILLAVVVFGLPLTDVQQVTIQAVLSALLTLWVRNTVTSPATLGQ